MQKTIVYILLLFLPIGVSAQSTREQRYFDYIDTYKDLAIEQMLKYNIPASITLAQGLLESGAGYSRLATKGNNHFGIKCHNWRGRTMRENDDAPNECFRVYKNARESYEDHSVFLTTERRYASLFKLSRYDYKGWARGLKAAGYATSPTYASSLISLIERYNLSKYDKATKYNKFVTRHEPREDELPYGEDYHPIYMTNRNFYVVAREGDTFMDISRELGISYGTLAKYNERNKKDVLSDGERVYLKKKRSKADKAYKKMPHIVQDGESMYDIAQQYGITLKSLYKMNKLSPNYSIAVGDTLRVY